MIKNYDGNNVLLKLVYYCNIKKEIYFKRSDVTEYLITSGIFTIPNKQGFDGNLSYFGFDIKNDSDHNRILLLRGKKLNERCLSGSLDIQYRNNVFVINEDDLDVFIEIDKLIDNKTREAKGFDFRKSIVKKLLLTECTERLFGNKKLYKKEGKYFVFPDIVIDCINNVVLYEIVKTENNEKYDVNYIFPILNRELNYSSEKIINYNEFGEINTDFLFYQYSDIQDMVSEFEIQEISNERIIRLINKLQYNLEGKESTKRVLNSIRLNTSALRALAINRDQYKCALCSVTNPKMLICSHIKPWKTGDGRLDINNVLTLCTLHDALFDKGFITFDENGKVLYSRNSIFKDKAIMAYLSESKIELSLELNSSMKQYIAYHRDHIFLEE